MKHFVDVSILSTDEYLTLGLIAQNPQLFNKVNQVTSYLNNIV